MPNATTRAETARWIFDELAKGFAEVLELMAGTRPATSYELLPAGPPAAGTTIGTATSKDEEFRWKQSLPPLTGEIYLKIARPDAWTIGRQVMLAAGVDDSSAEELHSTFVESVGQTFSVAARSMTARLEREVRSSGGEETGEFPGDALWASLQLTFGEAKLSLFLGLAPLLVDGLTIEQKPAAAASAGSASPTAPTVPAGTPAAALNTADSKTFDVLLDVELAVSISFGHAQVPLKEVLKLTTGSIVELSRAIVEPVDVVVNNRVIAHGEVVVVEGNFGVRIQHVVSRGDRLRSIQ